MAFIQVKKKTGTSSIRPPAGYPTWLNVWEERKGKNATTCEIRGCYGKADLAVHVITADGDKEYILPMCYSCNDRLEDEIYEAWKIGLASAR